MIYRVDMLAILAIRRLFMASPWLRNACSEASNELYYEELDRRAKEQEQARTDVEHDVGEPGDVRGGPEEERS